MLDLRVWAIWQGSDPSKNCIQKLEEGSDPCHQESFAQTRKS